MKNNILIACSLFILMFLQNNTLFSQQNREHYSIKPADINSDYSEYFATYYDSSMVFVSDRKTNPAVIRYDKKTGRSFSDLFTNSKDKKLLDLFKLI